MREKVGAYRWMQRIVAVGEPDAVNIDPAIKTRRSCVRKETV